MTHAWHVRRCDDLSPIIARMSYPESLHQKASKPAPTPATHSPTVCIQGVPTWFVHAAAKRAAAAHPVVLQTLSGASRLPSRCHCDCCLAHPPAASHVLPAAVVSVQTGAAWVTSLKAAQQTGTGMSYCCMTCIEDTLSGVGRLCAYRITCRPTSAA